MATGRIQPPNLDDRTWQQIVDETKRRIPEVAPEWTDHNPSDLGITLIELFAWMAEQIIWRLNQVPEKNYIAFLNLLDITRDPPKPARVALHFTVSRRDVRIPRYTQVATVATEQEDAVIFETDEETIVPGNFRFTQQSKDSLLQKDGSEGVPKDVLNKLNALLDQVYLREEDFLQAVQEKLSENEAETYGSVIVSSLELVTVFARNVLTLMNENLGRSTGEPFQVFSLKQAPLDQESGSLARLEIRVDGESWSRVEEFQQGMNQHYRCNPVTGEIFFGNQDFGGIPKIDAQITAANYRYVVGGVANNVAAKTVTVLRSPIDGVTNVINPQAAEGGTEWEPIEETKRRAPLEIKSRDRAVTSEDYEFHAKEATTAIAKARCLGPKKKPDGEYITEPIERTPGIVNVLLLPNIPFDANDVEITRKPLLQGELIGTVHAHLDKLRTMTGELMLHKPFYVEVDVKATIYVDKDKMPNVPENVEGKNPEQSIKEQVRSALIAFLHPVSGGLDGNGWDFGQSLFLPQVFEAIARIPEISFVQNIAMKRIDGQGNGEQDKILIDIDEHEILCATDPGDAGNFAITVKFKDESQV